MTVFVERNFIRMQTGAWRDCKPFVVLWVAKLEVGNKDVQRLVCYMRPDGSVGFGNLWQEWWEAW